ncbi:MAG TPA: flagellar biosynthesis anti-sigma factor FlgM [Acidobacteriaceae bacterium]|jgi:negative regulator of flagellin synthesis FlgM
MNVNNNNLQGLQQLFSSQEATRVSGKASSIEAQTEQPGGDRTTLSAAASLAAAAGPDSDVRMEKVAAIQQVLASGTYNVSSSEVAGKMIDHMLGK